VDRWLSEELCCVLGLHGATVENGDRGERLDEVVRVLADRGRRGLAGPDGPDRLVGDDQAVVLGQEADLPTGNVLGFVRFAFRFRLAHAGDHAEAGRGRGAWRVRPRVVRV